MFESLWKKTIHNDFAANLKKNNWNNKKDISVFCVEYTSLFHEKPAFL